MGKYELLAFLLLAWLFESVIGAASPRRTNNVVANRRTGPIPSIFMVTIGSLLGIELLSPMSSD